MASPSPYVVVTMTPAQQKAAAAAAARRKRRKVLRSQSPHRFQKRFKASPPPPRPPQGKRPLATTPVSITISTPTPKTSCSSRSATLYQPTVRGIHQVAAELAAGNILALPTECSYEAVTQLCWNEPNAWADRIQPLYSLCRDVDDEDDSDDVQPSLGQEHEQRQGENNTATANQNSSLGLEGQQVHNNDDDSLLLLCGDAANRSRVSSSDSSKPAAMTSFASNSQPPHIYLNISALEVHPFFRKLLPKRPYAVRNKEGEVLAAHALNETQTVLRLLATKIWPGPVTVHVSVNSTNSDPMIPSCLTVRRDGKEYLTLRSLCHPLTVKVYQEYLKKTSGTSEEPTEQQPDTKKPATAESPSKTARRLSLSKSQHLLVGMPLTLPDDTYITRATQVRADTLALHGEERREIFCVPTCEYERPSPISLWLDADKRQVVLVRADKNQSIGQHHDWTAEQLLQTLRSAVVKTGKDRVTQAVMNRWHVVEE